MTIYVLIWNSINDCMIIKPKALLGYLLQQAGWKLPKLKVQYMAFGIWTWIDGNNQVSYNSTNWLLQQLRSILTAALFHVWYSSSVMYSLTCWPHFYYVASYCVHNLKCCYHYSSLSHMFDEHSIKFSPL